MVNDPPKSLKKIVYYPSVQKPIAEYSTVQEVLRYSDEASNEVGQSIAITTFDLGVCMKDYPLIWNSQEKHRNHIIVIGSFHLIMAYFNMIGKKMVRSGFRDVLPEADMITAGSMTGVMNKRNYSRALNYHQTLTESIFRLLLNNFIEEHELSNNLKLLAEGFFA